MASATGCARKQADTRWEPLPLGTDASFEDLWFADSLHGWIVGGSYQVPGGLVGRTKDGGVTWEYSSGIETTNPGATPHDIEAIHFFDGARGLVAIGGGNIYATADSGATWSLVRQGRDDSIFDFDFLDSLNGWAAGMGELLRTTDGGANWLPVGSGRPEEMRLEVHAIDFVDSRIGWIAGHHGKLMKTEDGGATWAPVRTPLGSDERPFLFDVCFINAQTGWVAGENGTILHTNDGGASWVRQETGVKGARSVYKPEIIQRRAGVFDTVDTGGRTPGFFITSIRFLDSNRGWLVGHYGYEGRSLILGTRDGGSTWTQEGEAQGEELRALFVLDESHAWAVGDRVRPGAQVILSRRGLGPG